MDSASGAIMESSAELMPLENDLFAGLASEAEKVALHFEISHLYLAKHPELEKTIRSHASTSQLLFNSSSNLLIKCAITSQNITNLLFPVLRVAAEFNDFELAKSTFSKTHEWISEIHTSAVDLNNKFSSLHQEVGSDCSLVLSTQTESQNQSEKLKKEMKVHQAHMKSLNDKKEMIKAEIDQIQRHLDVWEKGQKDFVNEIRNRDKQFAMAALAIPIIGWFCGAIASHITSKADEMKVKQYGEKIARLWGQKLEKEKERDNLELKIFEEQMKFVSIQTNEGIMVSYAENLKNVDIHLHKAQDILKKMIHFWESVGTTIKGMEQSTEPSKLFLKDLEKYKSYFLQSLEPAEKVWKSFSSYCRKCKIDYDRKSKDQYQFLAVNPNSLSHEDWKNRVDAANTKLLNYYKPSSVQYEDAPSVAALPENV